MKKDILLTIVMFLLLLGSCQRNVYFSDFEKLFLDVYNEGDTLIFESDTGERDTAYILHKDIGYASWNPFAHAGKYKFLAGEIYGARNWITNDKPELREYLSLTKSHPDTTSLYIAYRNIIMLERFPELSQLSLARFKVDTNL
ncbi:hypothetical protein, partial [Parapedobacter sp. DT-150]|uniref:hypothetical protein n=1 Tax=Parapedobacter sp. DT-150 TaxID=3396162 RepID=UPI003F541C1A